MIVNVETGGYVKECELNRSYACCGCVNYYDESDFVCKCGCIHYVRKSPFISEKNKTLKTMESKFKLGDMFTKKHTRDTIPIEIYEISYGVNEPIYKLKPIKLCGDDIMLEEGVLIKSYNKIN